MALEASSDGSQSQTDDTTEVTWSATTECTEVKRYVLGPYYLHVQDKDTGVIRLVTGPCSYTLKPNERVALGPQPMVVVPSAHYCIVESPVVRADGIVAFDDFDQARLRHGEREVRLHQPPFPLYPGETLACSVQPLPVVGANQALRLRAVQDITDEDTQRKAGDEWLVKKKGAYIPAVGEEVVELRKLITLSSRQYCYICIPVVDDKPQYKIRQGSQSFFLQPGEVLEDRVRELCFLEASEGLNLVAREAFTDETVTPAVSRSFGDRWTVRGPAAVAPPFEADVLERRNIVIPLGPNEGVYVQNTVTGKVRAEMDQQYVLTAEERLWSKELPADAERLLAEYRGDTGPGAAQRDKTRVVTYRVPKGWIVIVDNVSGGERRDVSGDELATLEPDEQFKVFSLPGGTPVVLNHSQSLALPWTAKDHLTDIITVTGENQEQREQRVHMDWQINNPKIVRTDSVDRAFTELRRLLEDGGKTSLKEYLKNKYQHTIGFFNINYC